MKNKDVKALYEKYVLGTYTQLPVCLVRGKGAKVWDIEGKEYLDFFPGWAVSGLGHCPPLVTSSLRAQAGKLVHVANNFLNIKQARLAEALVKHSFPGKVFFCNSGAEANEGAIKFARKWGNPQGKNEIITMQQSFHGRTIATITATGQEKYRAGFDPLPGGFLYAQFNDLASLKKLISKKTAAILFEPIQGEGGIHVATVEYMRAVRRLCDEQNILMILDEVQTGMGRTGKMFAYQHYGVVPDLMTLAKSLGGGVPIGAFIVNNRLENVLVPGNHASTFGGNPLVCAAALATIQTIEKGNLLQRAETMGAYLAEGLEKINKAYKIFSEMRGQALMRGVVCEKNAPQIVAKAMEYGLLINCTQGNVLRIMPPLTVTKKEIKQALAIIEKAIKDML